ncbi:MAG: DUF1801 domain-containing protein [Lewinellaceae bacterium]|nr:DUF1801 domain-containing protein [Lewinellaceae bacterium]
MARENSEGTKEVEVFLDQLEHPMKPEVIALRATILNAQPELTEQIKWNAPSFCFQGQDRITFNLSGKGIIRLIFHAGVKTKVLNGPLMEDETGLLEWASNDRAILKFASREDVEAKSPALEQLARQWIAAAEGLE